MTVWIWSLALYSAWTVTWFVFERLVRGPWPALHESEWVWWIVAKCLVWIAPLVAIVRAWRVGSIGDWLGIRRVHRLGQGVVIAAAWIALCAIVDALVKRRWPDAGRPEAGVLLTILGTLAGATLEEVPFRGFVLRALVESGLSFWRANAMAALLFALLHVPGWLFMGWSLRAIGAAMPSVILVGLLCGLARMGNASLWASVTVHLVNNLWSGGLLLYALRCLLSHAC